MFLAIRLMLLCLCTQCVTAGCVTDYAVSICSGAFCPCTRLSTLTIPCGGPSVQPGIAEPFFDPATPEARLAIITTYKRWIQPASEYVPCAKCGYCACAWSTWEPDSDPVS
ncbi:uncharacterized protein RAG0_12695 [Rhynchosporium agropyri]|uniref:Secreted protein n=1 Tax=Rhynchosporium agropyri TaxID=914238 RepID=A0A1E1L986_9HELO|nr:uncharacterized protein RAG0_12695 [Rhynchosporium agropyri]